MAYSYPEAGAVAFEFTGASYTRPAADAANFFWAPEEFSASVAAAIELEAAATVTHGITAAAVDVLDLVAAVQANHESAIAVANIAAAIELEMAASAGHGVAATAACGLELEAAGAAGHGIAGAAAADLDLEPAASAGHGIAGPIAATLEFEAAAAAVHERYELRGEVRLAGVLVNRRVRAYLRDSGALVGEVDTVAGRFAIHSGFSALEHYVVPIDLDAGATDWTPPTANRVLSVLAEDA